MRIRVIGLSTPFVSTLCLKDEEWLNLFGTFDGQDDMKEQVTLMLAIKR